jgi:metal iron transporter
MSLIPAMTVAVAVGKPGINALLVVSQVVLSIVLPFITFPLIYLTSCKSVMSVKKPLIAAQPDGGTDQGGQTEVVDYSNGKIVTGLAWVIWLAIFAANMYVIVMLALGSG